jgi:hypothetical protein
MQPDIVQDRDWADAWLYAILEDPHVTDGAARSCSLLRLRWNHATCTATPSVDGWARDTAQHRRTIQNQRDALRAKGLLRWSESKGRVRAEYQLLITSAVRRMFVKLYPCRAAEVGTIQPPPVGRSTSAAGCANLRRVADRTLKPTKPLRGSAPRAPDGAAVAARLGEAGSKLLDRVGPAMVAAWFWDVSIEGSTVIVPSQMKANRFLGPMRCDLDAALPPSWTVRVQSSHGGANAA